MNKFIFSLIFLSLSFLGFSQSASPKSIGLTQDFSGVVTTSVMFDGELSFEIKDPKNGKIKFYFSTDGAPVGNDPYSLNCKISEELKEKIEMGEAANLKVKVRAKSTYGLFENYSGASNFQKKRIVWRPISVE